MKKIFRALILLITLSLALTGCKTEKYPPVDSSKEEAAVVMTLELDGKRYDIRYELYRALFLSYRETVDGGDRSVWSGENSSEYITRINQIISEKAAEIYAVLHLAEQLGIDPYSDAVEEEIDEYIEISVEGNGADVTGFGGDYDAYLAALKEQNLNYSVQKLLLRYSAVLKLVNEYYFGTEDEVLGSIPGEYQFTEEDVHQYYLSDESVRLLHAYMQEGVATDTGAKMEEIRSGVASASDAMEAALYIINHTSMTPTDLIVDKKVSGIMVGRHTLSDGYSNYAEAAFALSDGETSEIIEVNDGTLGYYVIYRVEKTEEHFEDCYEDVKASYLDNVISERLLTISASLSDSLKTADGYSDIRHSDISMD